jgi:hypothetical protein
MQTLLLPDRYYIDGLTIYFLMTKLNKSLRQYIDD